MQDDLMRKLAVGASSLALCLGASAGVAWACDGQGGAPSGDNTSAAPDDGSGSTTDTSSTDSTSTDSTQTAAAKRRAAKRRAARRAAARRRHARHA